MTPNEWKQFGGLLNLIRSAEGINMDSDEAAKRDRANRIRLAREELAFALVDAVLADDPHYVTERRTG